MDEAVLRERRAARRRQVRRRRQARFAGLVCAVVVLVVALTSRAGDRPSRTGPAAAAATRIAPAMATAAERNVPATRGDGTGRRSAAAAGRVGPATLPVPGAHRAPHEAVPILMYHVIGTRGPTTPNPGLWVAPADFRAHVLALREAGYNAVTLQTVWNAWHRRGLLPSKPLVLSFDDGYAGQVRDALPALAAAGWPAVLNLAVANLADLGGTKAVKRLIAAGWEIDAHTISHPDLTTLGPDGLRAEIAGSRARLRRLFGVPVSFFCYPSGRYDATVIAAVKAAGFVAATTTQLGWASPAGDPFTLARVRVDGGMTADAVLTRLRDARPA